MKRCERESEVAAAMRAGLWTEELRDHLRSCASCSETERVASALLLSAAAMGERHEPPAADLVWRRARARMQEEALKRAMRPLIFMRRVSFGFIAVFAVWVGWELWRSGFSGYRVFLPGMDFMATGAAGVGVAIALLSIAAGSWWLLRGRKQSGIMPSV
jgi:hypothetical protein